MTNDRNYLRMLRDNELARYARDNAATDLELVLAERLADLVNTKEYLEAAKAEIEDLEAEIAILKAQ
jgi:hypothetical protein